MERKERREETGQGGAGGGGYLFIYLCLFLSLLLKESNQGSDCTTAVCGLQPILGPSQGGEHYTSKKKDNYITNDCERLFKKNRFG